MEQWRPTQKDREAIDLAVYRIGSNADRLWHDDMRQAALIALWRYRTTPQRRQQSTYDIARRAALDELRRVTYWRRAEQPGWGVLSDVDDATPEAHLACRQALSILLGMPLEMQAVVSAVLECDTKAEAAARLGVDPSRVTQLMTHQRLDDRRSVAVRLSAAL